MHSEQKELKLHFTAKYQNTTSTNKYKYNLDIIYSVLHNYLLKSDSILISVSGSHRHYTEKVLLLSPSAGSPSKYSNFLLGRYGQTVQRHHLSPDSQSIV